MNFFDAVRSVLSQYVGFSGRALRSEYWFWVLFTVLLSIVTSIIDVALFPFDDVSPLSSITNLALLLPGLAVSARRLHDVGRSGWWLLLAIVPVIGWIILLIWTVTKGDAAANRFGPPPQPTAGSPAVA
ncbi:DUF805 domain-containing protein [Azospirillum sp.]|uniref:DUF805 domain-containing protein n=1 Tax=Azospirillum sp. TaxID=34012 RepID=UPI002D74D9C0|nr:DUF805 domain-containing protein [Azospirillum sp.]HYF85594.1 DUF805 domain-containing protein [Azospirillum sp.]